MVVGVAVGVPSDAILAVSSCLVCLILDSADATASSGSTADVTETNKVFVLEVDASFAEAERAAESESYSSAHEMTAVKCMSI